MRERKKLSKLQIFCIVALWVLLCVALFILPSDQTIAEKTIYCLLSGGIIYAGVRSGLKKANRQDRNR
ncbi:hypothetical protein LJB91_01135 [Bacteroidales bacterium OttesenSCG-928-L03]|nr:hypothetical protein [Bacteroidales bacterium OttesenSCG-928-L03]